MEKYILSITSTEYITHNVKRFRIEKPKGLTFLPGQAAHLSINQPVWREHLRPFTFTGLASWNYLEFVIKLYPDHHGVTGQLAALSAGDELILHDVFGSIRYYGEGTFIAGGSGITPFIAIFRELDHKKQLGNNVLLFSNAKAQDIILKEEFSQMLGARFINTLTQENVAPFDHRMIDKNYLQDNISNLNQYFYICGPDKMVESIHDDLLALGANRENIIIEQF